MLGFTLCDVVSWPSSQTLIRDEMIRVVDALQFTEEHGEVCPAGWRKGEAGMTPTAAGVSDYLSQHSEKL